MLKGYGDSVNYRMGAPLLQDVVQSMEKAIVSEEGNLKQGLNFKVSFPVK